MSAKPRRRRRPASLAGAAPLFAALGDETRLAVRVRHGKLSVTDGPFAETKEQLAGFYLLEAASLEEAIEMAAKIPPAREGSIEVRPVRELEP